MKDWEGNIVKIDKTYMRLDFAYTLDGHIPDLYIEGAARVPKEGENFWCATLLEIAIRKARPEYQEDLMAKYFGLTLDNECIDHDDERYDEDATTIVCYDITTSYHTHNGQLIEEIRVTMCKHDDYERKRERYGT